MSVYFAQVKGYIKIGYSAKPWVRIGTTTRDTTIKPDDVRASDDVSLIGWFPGDRKVEKLTHEHLADHQVAGEWFTDCDEVRAYLRSQADAVLMHEMSGMAVLKHLNGMPIAEAVAAHPMRTAREVMNDPNGPFAVLGGRRRSA